MTETSRSRRIKSQSYISDLIDSRQKSKSKNQGTITEIFDSEKLSPVMRQVLFQTDKFDRDESEFSSRIFLFEGRNDCTQAYLIWTKGGDPISIDFCSVEGKKEAIRQHKEAISAELDIVTLVDMDYDYKQKFTTDIDNLFSTYPYATFFTLWTQGFCDETIKHVCQNCINRGGQEIPEDQLDSLKREIIQKSINRAKNQMRNDRKERLLNIEYLPIDSFYSNIMYSSDLHESNFVNDHDIAETILEWTSTPATNYRQKKIEEWSFGFARRKYRVGIFHFLTKLASNFPLT